jgi:DNA polymerase-1
MSKQIATLFTDAPLPLDLTSMDVHNFDGPALRQKLTDLEFKAILRQLSELPINGNNSLDGPAEQKTKHERKNSVKLVLAENADFVAAKKLFVYARSRQAHGFKPEFVVAGTHEWVTIIEAKNFSLFAEYFNRPLYGYDLKSTIKVLHQLGVKELSVAHDVQVGAFLINSLDRDLHFNDLADRIDMQATDLSEIPPEDIGEFAPNYIAAMAELVNEQQDELVKMPKLAELAKNIEWPSLPVLARMEQVGVILDTDYLAKMSRQFEDEISDIEQTIYGHAEQEFNISSPSQLADVLFNGMGLPTTGIKKGKTGYSTAANELDKLRSYHPIIDCITKYREYTKLKSTYIDALPKLTSEDGRLRTTFNVTVAQTGRLSSADPNLQNIPVRSELGRSIRMAFVAGKGNEFVSADYSQFELRLAAVMAGDNDMIEVFNSGADIHVRTAAEVYGVALDDVTKEMRNNAKTINFGVLYGMSPHGLAVATGMTFGDAKEFIDRYFATRQPLVDYIKNLRTKAKEVGYVETLFGRRRPTPDVHSSNFIVREAAYRQAVNMPIQGTEADLMKMAMIEVEKKLPKNCSQLLQIHDSILVECPKNKVTEVSQMLKDTMENIYPNLGITLSVDIHSGSNWGEL